MKVMLIRHGEKPEEGGDQGVASSGAANPHELTVRGWQRAGALVRLFNPRPGSDLPDGLGRPRAIFAAAAAPGSGESLRPQQTVPPLCEDIGVTPDCAHGQGQVAALTIAILASDGPVLVCWHHEAIPAIVAALAPDVEVPAKWPKDRFDLVWVLGRPLSGRTWRFSQASQSILPGDG